MEGFTASKEGVYRHELLGLFATQEEAVAKALEACKNEVDDYHEFHVLKLTANGETLLGVVSRRGYNPPRYEPFAG
jgi:hypothetical protein